MATFTVTALDDVVDAGDTIFTLREAVEAANATEAEDTIVFAPGLAGTLVLTQENGPLEITGDLEILGNTDPDGMAAITISGGDETRHFSVLYDYVGFNATSLSLSDLTLSDGASSGNGGSIFGGIRSDIVLNRMTFSGNSADSSGGAIYSGGTLEANESLFTENTAGSDGGAIVLGGSGEQVILENTVIAFNEAGPRGGGVASFAQFADIFVRNSTITGNTAADQGGGINMGYRSGNALTLANSVVAGNTATAGADIYTETATVTLNASFVGTAIGVPDSDPPMIVTTGATIAGGDAMLGPLADNGGPVMTVEPLLGSPLAGAGDDSFLIQDFDDKDGDGDTDEPLPIDANGDPRVVGRLDIGATERQEIVVTTLDDVVDPEDDLISLREAVAGAGQGDRITFAPDLSGGVLALTTGEAITIETVLTIDGDLDDDGAPDITITGDVLGDDVVADGVTDIAASTESLLNDNTQLFTMPPPDFKELSALGSVTLDGLVLTGGRTAMDNAPGGAIAMSGTAGLEIRNSLVAGNSTAGESSYGGAIYSAGGITVIDSVLTGNMTSGRYGDGGAIYAAMSLTVVGSTIAANMATGEGARGGAAQAGVGTIARSVVSDNMATSNGGGLSLGGESTIYASLIEGNATMDGRGGGIDFYGPGQVVNSTVVGNMAGGATSDGGGVYFYNAGSVVNATVTGNMAGQNGGGAGLAPGAMLSVVNAIVAGNASASTGPEISGNDAATSMVVFEGGNVVGADVNLAQVSFAGGDAPILIDGTSAAALGTVFASVGADPDTGVTSGLLADNGGQAPTVALLALETNPALDASDTTAPILFKEFLGDFNGDGDMIDAFTSVADLTFDARGPGFPRDIDIDGVGSTPDLGAFELAELDPVFPPALAVDDEAMGVQFTPIFAIDVTANDTSAETILELQGLTSGNSARTEGGRVFNNGDGTLAYAPLRGFTGTDSVDYVIEGPDGSIDTGSVEIAVTAIDPELEIARLVGYLFEAGLGRQAGVDGLNFFADRVLDEGATETELARGFLNSEEFEERAGGAPETLTDRELVEQLFLNVLERPGAEAGIQSFVDDLAAGLSREQLLITFAQSPENLLGSPTIADIVELADGSFDFA